MKHELSSVNQEKLNELFCHLKKLQNEQIGYPCSGMLDCKNLAPFLDLNINNVGDPFEPNYYKLHTFDLELEILRFFANIFKIDFGQYWGYVTNGGTEGNMFGLRLGREKYPTAPIYYSNHSHYSIEKSVDLLRVQGIKINSDSFGEIDYVELKEKLDTTKPAILSLNIGTTMFGAIDKVEKVLSILENKNIKEYYIHCDAALFGIMLPFMDNAPKFAFDLPIDSISVSGHKFLGSPIPCGVVLCKLENKNRVVKNIQYIGGNDCTISGSRDGFSVIILWEAISKYGLSGIKEMVKNCIEITDYLNKSIRELNINSWKNPNSNIVVFPSPSEQIIRKWQLATQDKWSHVVVMPHVTKEIVNKFLQELKTQLD